MKIINEIQNEYRKNKVVTGFMGLVVIFAFLTYLKPSSTSGILTYIGLTAVNFIFFAFVIALFWWVYWRKNK